MTPAKLARRAAGALSRRLDRPELLSVLDPAIRQAEHEEIAIRALFAATLRGGSLYVDVGTNRGQLLAEAVRVSPYARQIAFEPIPALAEEIAARFPAVDCRRLAVGARVEEARFCHFTKLDGWSGLRRSPEISDERGAPQFIDVHVSTIDSELAGLAPTLIKIDVEGAELGVLEGGRELLTRVRPLLVVEHVAAAAALYETSSEQLWELLDELGYSLFAATGEGPLSRAAFAAPGRGVNWLEVPDGQLSSATG